MIQRIQSLYLLAGLILSVAIIFSGAILVSSGSEFLILGAFGAQAGELELAIVPMLPLGVLAGLNVLVEGYAISQFKNRKLQINLAKLSAVIAVLMIGWIGFVYYSLMQMEVDINPIMGIFHSPMIVFANILAIRGIKKDEALLKSVDRLR